MRLPFLILTLTALVLSACATTAPAPDGAEVSRSEGPRILAMGDSLMAWHGISGRSIAHSVASELQEPVVNRSVGGARILYKLPISGAAGFRIESQFSGDGWDWVVLNGGGNDLWLGCGCKACERKLDKLISQNGRGGAIAKLVTDIRKTGARVVWVGYLRSPGVGSMIDECRSEGDVLEARIARLADQVEGVYFLSNAELVPHGDRSFHGVDMIHPSVKASTIIGQRVAELIKAEDKDR
ncbi:hypothetical protein NBRC116590_22440 [Pelagimonas sp. KU-00592-HH]|uniref:SGNH/GDSL hydrolase family protein n=1 Tax=Pelagimonas sp. KU-00592-HH TaxID=3127651 RepID=UPI0031032631